MSPKRPRSHQLEDESKKAFKSILPTNWIYRDKQYDYGIDGEVEIFDEENNTTGNLFYVQLKSTDSKNLNDISKTKLKVDTYNYFSSLKYPVLIVNYSSYFSKIYIRWSHAKLKKEPIEQQKWLTFHFHENDEAEMGSCKKIENDVNEYLKIRNTQIKLPIKITILLEDNIESSISIGDIILANEKISEKYKRFIEFKVDANIKYNARLFCRKDYTLLSIGGDSGSFKLASLLDYKNNKLSPEKFIYDIYVTLGCLLYYFRHTIIANELFISAYHNSTLINNQLRAVAMIVASLFEAKQLLHIADLLVLFLNKNTYNDYQALSALLMSKCNLSVNEDYNFVIKLYKIIEDFLIQNSAPKEIVGTINYNIGNICRRAKKLRLSIYHYNIARKLETKYLKKTYFITELAGSLFMLRRYKFSAILYAKAIRLEKENDLLALFADALLFSGKYRKSLKYFKKYTKVTKEPDALWAIKKYCLDLLFESNKICSQKRNSSAASLILDNLQDSPTENDYDKIFECDLLSSKAWFELGLIYFNEKKNEKALYAFLWSAISNESNMDSWINAFNLSLKSLQADSAAIIFEAAYSIWEFNFIESLFESIDRNCPLKTQQLGKNLVLKMKNICDEKKGKETTTIRFFDSNMPDMHIEKEIS